MKDNRSAKLIYIFLILQPVIDLFTSLTTRFLDIPITIGAITRGLFLLILVFLVLFKGKNNKKTIYYFVSILIFIILYFVTKKDIFNINFIVTEILYLFKYMYFPIVTVCLISLYEQLQLEKEKILKIGIINLVVYSLMIIIPEITGTSFSSYLDDNIGSVGWFYSANEIGAITVSLLPSLYYLLFERKPVTKIVIVFSIVILAMTLLGTKTSFLGILITEVLYLIYYFLNRKKNRGLGLKISLLIVFLSFVFIPNIPAVKNLQKTISDVNDTEVSEDVMEEDIVVKNKDVQKIISVALSGRDKFFFRTMDIYNKSNIDSKLFGIGFVNRTEINNKHIEKLIEIDPLDVYFHYGIIGFIIYFIPLLYIIGKSIKYTIKNKFKLSYFKLTNIYTIGIITLVSMMAGHIYGAPAVSIYIALSIAMLDNGLKKEELEEKTKEKNKITIFALHLNYGGVEQYISSLCKMLGKDYDIEIISTYKINDKPAFYFDKNIKIKYLIEGGPNKEELKDAIRNKNIVKIIKEGFKSIKILYLKKYRNIKAIRETYSDYIITTRTFHNRLVGYYAYYDIKKIATEHNYHNNDNKYIKKLINSIVDFDYFVVVTENLKSFYEHKIKNTKCIYIPNVIDELPEKCSDLKENNIINVGRFEEEKAQEELVYIVKELKKDIEDIKLYLIGDGSLKQQITDKIKENDLEENIILTGFIPKKEVEKYMIKSKLFVLTSYTESFGLVLIEAMSYKVPCIAYDSADGARVLLKDNIGILINNRDRIQMVDKIKELLVNDDALNNYSNAGYNSCKKYLGNNVKKQWLEILNRDNKIEQ